MPQNKTLYELFLGRKPTLSFMRPFRCPVTILNTLDHLGTGPNWMFDIDTLTMSMNYQPVFAENQTNGNSSTKANINEGQGGMKTVPGPQYVLLPFFTSDSQSSKSSKDKVVNDARKKNEVLDPAKEDDKSGQGEATNTNSTNRLNTISSSINIVSSSFNTMDPGRERAQRNEFESVLIPVNAATLPNADLPTYPLMFDLEDTANLLNTSIFSGAYDDEDMGAEVDLNNLETTMNVSPIPTTMIHKDHPKEQIIKDPLSAPQTRRMTKSAQEHAMINYIKKQRRTNHKDYQNYLFAYFLSQIEPKKVTQALTYPSWIEAMQDELLQFRLQKDRSKSVILAYDQLWGIYCVQMDVKNAFYMVLLNSGNGFRKGTIDKTLFIKKDKGDILLVKVYVDSIIFGSTKNSLCTEFESLMHKKFQISSLGELTFFLGLQVRQRDDVIFISQDKYVADILKKFDFSLVKTASTPIETNKALLKDEEGEDVDVHLYRSMIGSLMYLTRAGFKHVQAVRRHRASIFLGPQILDLFQVTPKVSHLHAVKRVFRNLKGQPKLGLWYPRDSPFDLEAFLDSDYARAIDGKEFTIIEASVRRHLQLADVEGNSALSTIEIFDQLSLMGNMKRGFSGEHTPLFPSMLAIQAEEGEGSGHPSEPQPPPSNAQPTYEEPIPNVVSSSPQKTQTPRQALQEDTQLPQTSVPIPNVVDEAIFKEWDGRVVRATTTTASLDAAQASGNITKTQSTTIPNVPLPQGIGTGGSPRSQEAIGGSFGQTRSERVPTPLYDSPLLRVNTLGSDEVKKLKKIVKIIQARRRAKIVVSDDEDDLEDSSKQGRMIEEIDQDVGVTLVTPIHSQEDQPEDQLGAFSAAKVLADAAKNVHTYTRTRRAVSTGSGGVSTAEELVSTAGASMPVSTAAMQEQDRLGHEAAVRLQEELNEEERQRMARVHASAQSFTEEEWENIRARVEADEELTQRL
ncbi:uncharacterized mitochondrial protein-like protein [Tanacetum coccineum]